MITLAQLYPDAKRILGTCDEEYLNARINEAVELLANKGDFDPYICVVDIAATGKTVPLPPEVETVLSVNMCGVPGRGLDRFFNFHLDGPGDFGRNCGLRWQWKDEGESPVFANPPTFDSRLFALAANPADAGAILTVYGTDQQGDPLGTVQAGVFVAGLPVIVQASPGVPPPLTEPQVNRIDRVSKPDTRGAIHLLCRDNTLNATALLAVYRTNWKEPLFRLITLDKPSPWVRVLFRRKPIPLALQTDLIPLHSTAAVLAMLRALKYYDEGEISAAQAYEATAMRWLEEEQKSRRANLYMPPQIDIDSSLLPTHDQLT